MKYNLLAIPREQDLKLLNNLRDYVYKNGFRFKNKPLSSDTHITFAEVELTGSEINKLYQYLQTNISLLKIFSVNDEEWELTNKVQNPNYKLDKSYSWIALKFPQRREMYNALDKLTKDLNFNNNKEYIDNVKKIEGDIPDDECIANHINLSNYTRVEKSKECWEYFKDNLPKSILFDKIILIDGGGKEIFRLTLEKS